MHWNTGIGAHMYMHDREVSAVSLYLQCLLPPDLQQQQPLQTVGHGLQSPLREFLHPQPSTVRRPCPLIQADEREVGPIRWHGGTGELGEEVGADPGAATEESVPGRQHGRLQVRQLSEEAASDGGQLDAGLSQQSSDGLQRGGGAVCLLLELQLPQLHGLRSSAVALTGKQTHSYKLSVLWRNFTFGGNGPFSYFNHSKVLSVYLLILLYYKVVLRS